MSNPDWTQEEAVAFEAARECITHLSAIVNAEIHAEASKPVPDLQRMTLLEEESLKLFREGRALSLKGHAEIARVRREYGARIRAWNENHPAPSGT